MLALLAERGALPQEAGAGMVAAMLNLRDTGGGRRGSGGLPSLQEEEGSQGSEEVDSDESENV